MDNYSTYNITIVKISWLVVTGTMEWIMTFHLVGNVIIPTDKLIFFRGVETTNQYYKYIYMVEAAVWNIMKHVMIVTVFIYHYQYIKGF